MDPSFAHEGFARIVLSDGVLFLEIESLPRFERGEVVLLRFAHASFVLILTLVGGK